MLPTTLLDRKDAHPLAASDDTTGSKRCISTRLFHPAVSSVAVKRFIGVWRMITFELNHVAVDSSSCPAGIIATNTDTDSQMVN